jgi:maleate isomerase
VSQPTPREHLRLGLATPQANPTAEPEVAALLPSGVDLLATRCVSDGDPCDRLLAYFDRLPDWLHSFGGLKLAAFGFACTASSYLLEPGREEAACADLADRFGYPVITAASAVERTLREAGTTRLAIASPYPIWIHELCVSYWRRKGFEVTDQCSAVPDMGDTKAIYDLDPGSAERIFVDSLQDHRAEVILVTGTGLPSLAMLPRLERSLGVPALSSNLCLANSLLAAARIEQPFVD